MTRRERLLKTIASMLASDVIVADEKEVALALRARLDPPPSANVGGASDIEERLTALEAMVFADGGEE